MHGSIVTPGSSPEKCESVAGSQGRAEDFVTPGALTFSVRNKRENFLSAQGKFISAPLIFTGALRNLPWAE